MVIPGEVEVSHFHDVRAKIMFIARLLLRKQTIPFLNITPEDIKTALFLKAFGGNFFGITIINFIIVLLLC